MNKLTSALGLVILYTAYMGAMFFVLKEVFGVYYGAPQMALYALPFMLVLVVGTLYVSRKIYPLRTLIAGSLRAKGLLWSLPWGLLMFAFTAESVVDLFGAGLPPSLWLVAAAMLGTALLVGIGEEVVFRGVLLRALVERGYHYSALLGSAVAFSLLHAVNVFGGLPFEAMLAQLWNTFLFGLAFAPLALRMGTLVPLILYHALWDGVLFLIPFSGGMSEVFVVTQNILMYLTIAVLWIAHWRFKKGVYFGSSV